MLRSKLSKISKQIGKRIDTPKIVTSLNSFVNSIDTQNIVKGATNLTSSINKRELLKNAMVARDKSLQIIEEKVPVYPKSATAISFLSGFTFKGLVFSPEKCDIKTVKKALEEYNKK